MKIYNILAVTLKEDATLFMSFQRAIITHSALLAGCVVAGPGTGCWCDGV